MPGCARVRANMSTVYLIELCQHNLNILTVCYLKKKKSCPPTI